MDQFLINKTQDGYDYLWNNYGLTKGMLCIFLLLAPMARSLVGISEGDNFSYFMIGGFAYFMYLANKQHSLQLMSKYERLNKSAMGEQTSLFAKALRYVMLFLLAGAIFKIAAYGINLVTLVWGSSFTLYLYASTVFVRARELPEAKLSFSPGV